MSEKHVALYYKEGSSDKEYHVHLVKQGSGYIVRIEYGRRGSSLTSSSKTPNPISLDAANKIFDAQMHAKKLKGYTEGAGQTPYVGGDKENKITGILPQLLNNIEEDELETYFEDFNYCLQEKKDGKRILLRRQKGIVEAINRKGLLVGFPAEIAIALEEIPSDFIFDGELIGETIWLFDALEYAGTDLRPRSYEQRYLQLSQALSQSSTKLCSSIKLVATTFDTPGKQNAFETLRSQGVEGVVFKNINAPYKAGRPASKGDQLKFKFTNTCTCQVSALNDKGKRSVYIQMRDGKKLVDVGKVTILPNFSVPEVGTLVEVKYLYQHIHGALYQPVYLGERDDLNKPDQVATLKVKEGLEDDDSES
ncbi:MAG: hypothetical protein WA766_14025 [Candidatus Acidiferrales bacterium]